MIRKMFKQLFLSKKEKTLNKIKKQCAIDLDSSAISNILENEKISKNILKAYGNVTPTGGRNGNPQYTKANIVEFIINNNGANFLNLDIIFLFQTDFLFSECIHGLVRTYPWIKHQLGQEDVAHTIRINKLLENGTFSAERLEFIFN
ncbi:hypothetical protein GLOIN_2v1771665 [Rhizophagus clarus]|uniref:Uncharacterized protein n=1 Tax=Rhizophagus clarus TaxID=94130 RepID=A0A8H3R4A2_9GLOM|nr:hypothetical protein GLOIN_2v1771665 [Rhizophagus clarus]